MSLLNRLLKREGAEHLDIADVAGGPQISQAYEASHAALAGLVPVAALAPEGGLVLKATDIALGFIIPLHSHVAMNSVMTDYVPKSVRGAPQVAVLAASGLATLGFLRLNLFGPGITTSVKDLWRKRQ